MISPAVAAYGISLLIIVCSSVTCIKSMLKIYRRVKLHGLPEGVFIRMMVVSNVLADIRNTISKCSESFVELNFQLSNYSKDLGDGISREYPMYLLTKDGMMMLTMGYTTPDAMRIKEAYIARFNEMERELANARNMNAMMPGMPDGKRPLCDIAAIFSAAGVTGNQLALALDNVYKAETGMSVLAVAGIQLVSPVQEHLFTPTELGGMLGGLSGKTVNHMLADAGLQYRLPDGKWVLTELGKQYGVILDTGKRHSAGTPITQLKWYQNVLDTIDAE